MRLLGGALVAISVGCAGCGGASGRARPAHDARPSAAAPHARPSALPSPAADAGGAAPIVGEYAVVWEPAAGVVKVEGRFTARAGAMFSLERGVEPFAQDIEMSADRDGATWSPVTRRGRQIEVSACAT